ncbi:MAG: dephospho-CoA kinase [Dehalococcoidales bacterium]|nr:dephospho-CoA kinase [Dehalococcoidales bacterium]
MMKVIGLTGGIGSGKSTVSRFLAELGAVILDADRIGHEAFKPDTEIWREVVATFGRQILTPNGDIDRKKLSEIVFGNPKAQAHLNQIMHPRMYEIVKAQLGEFRQQGVDVVVLEAPLLIEAGWTSLVDKVWVTVASEATVLSRLQEQKGLSKRQALARIRSQMPSAERVKYGDVVINSDCRLDELKARVEELWLGLH